MTTCLQPKESSWNWDRSKSQQYWGWEATLSNPQFRSRENDKPEPRGDLDNTESARGHRGSSTKSDGDDRRASQRSPRHKPVESAVRPTTLPEGWTVFVNSLGQVHHSHVKTGIICFQVHDNREDLNNKVFKGVAAATDRVDRKRPENCKPCLILMNS